MASSDSLPITITISGNSNDSNLILNSTSGSIVEGGSGSVTNTLTSSDPKLMRPIFTVYKNGAVMKYNGVVTKSLAGKTVALLSLYPEASKTDGGLIAIDCEKGSIMWFRSIGEKPDTSTKKYLFDPAQFGKYSEDASGTPNSSTGHSYRVDSFLTHPVMGAFSGGYNQIRNKPFIDAEHNLVWVNSAMLPYIGAYDIDTGNRNYQFDGFIDYANPKNNSNRWDEFSTFNNTHKNIRNNLYVEYENGNPMVYYGATIVSEYQFRNFFSQDDTEKLGAFGMTGQLRKMNANNPSTPVWDFFNNPEEILGTSGEVIPDTCFRPSTDELTCKTALEHGLPFTDFSNDSKLNTVDPSLTSVYVHVQSSPVFELSYNELLATPSNELPLGLMNVPLTQTIRVAGSAPVTQTIVNVRHKNGVELTISGEDVYDASDTLVTDSSFGIKFMAMGQTLGIVNFNEVHFRVLTNDADDTNARNLTGIGNENGFVFTSTFDASNIVSQTVAAMTGQTITYSPGQQNTFQFYSDMKMNRAYGYADASSNTENSLSDIEVQDGSVWSKLQDIRTYDASVPYHFSFTSGTTLDKDAIYVGTKTVDGSSVDVSFTGLQLIGPQSPQNPVPTLMKIKVKKGFVFSDTKWSKYIAYTQNYYGCSVWQEDYVVTPGQDGTISFPVGNATRSAADESFFLEKQTDLVEGLLDLEAEKITLAEYEQIAVTQTNQTPYLSPRGKRALHSSVVTIKKSDAALIQVLKTVNYDCWDGGALGGIGAFFGQPLVVGQPNNRGRLYRWGPDGDTVNPILLDNGMIGMASKSGLAVFGNLHNSSIYTPVVTGDIKMMSGISSLRVDPSGTVRYFIGYSGTIGGTNYRCDTDGKSLFCCQSNYPLHGMLTIDPVSWETKDGQHIAIGNQYTVAVNEKGIVWERLNRRGGFGAPGITANAPCETVYKNGAVWAPNNNGALGFDPLTGAVKYDIFDSKAIGGGLSGQPCPTIGEGFALISDGNGGESHKIEIYKF